MNRLLILIAGVAMSVTSANAQTTIATGKGQMSAALSGVTLNVFTYKPATCTPQQLVVVFHGLGRDAGPYRDHARALADLLCAIIIAPEFDAQRFPTALYQLGGNTVDFVAPLVEWGRKAAGQPDMPYILTGHSAGGQFLSRVAAYTAPPAMRIIIANPSTWVLPSEQVAQPYGFGGIANAEQSLKTYLALPILVLLGSNDTGSHNLSATKEAMAQGSTRLARGHYAFEMARAVAQKHGWPFGWTLVEVPGVGHEATRMFSAPQTAAALGK
jgi:poly(3-hydroxybutyrate) depolymerase